MSKIVEAKVDNFTELGGADDKVRIFFSDVTSEGAKVNDGKLEVETSA